MTKIQMTAYYISSAHLKISVLGQTDGPLNGVDVDGHDRHQSGALSSDCQS